ncbi:hypothetical protein BD309DRAFT_1084623 [Dichomitus squalens]|nr:hypothetical protein BD309DRAFT_1084623 [Dichomitus squalens]
MTGRVPHSTVQLAGSCGLLTITIYQVLVSSVIRRHQVRARQTAMMSVWNKIPFPAIAEHLPVTDRNVLAGLATTSDVHAWTIAKVDEYRRLAFVLLSIYNVATPIHRLPTEILEQIFERRWDNRARLHLSHVCRRWRDNLLPSARFWAGALESEEFDVSQAIPPYLKALLSRAKHNPRGISLRFWSFPLCVESLTLYFDRLVLLQVAANEDDLPDGLWPALRSGMPRLRDLCIQVLVTRRGLDECSDPNNYSRWAWFYDPYECTGWSKPSLLSADHLPSLTRLTCPPSILGHFSDILFRHVKLQWWELVVPDHIKQPYHEWIETLRALVDHDALETLEVMPWDFAAQIPSRTFAPATFPLLRYLRIENNFAQEIVQLMTLLLFPVTTRIHLVNSSSSYDPNISELLPQEDDAKLRAIVGAVDCVHIEQAQLVDTNTPDSYRNYYFIRCYAADLERLRMDKCTFSPDGLVDVFRDHARVTRLVLSLEESGVPLDFRAFPQLEDLDVSGPYVDYTLDLLRPIQSSRTERPMNTICPSLARLVVRLRNPVSPKVASTEFEDVVSGDRCSGLREVLARRATPYRNRLSYLEINLPPLKESGLGRSISRTTISGLRVLVDGPVIVKSGE